MAAYYEAAARRGLPLGDQGSFLNPMGVADELISVDAEVSDVYEMKVAGIRMHRSQRGELERIPRDLQPLHLAHECFVEAWPGRAPGGSVLSDLFDDVVPVER